MDDKLGSGEHVLSAFSPLTSLLNEKADGCAASVQLGLESVDTLQGTTFTGPFPVGKNSRLAPRQSQEMLKLSGPSIHLNSVLNAAQRKRRETSFIKSLAARAVDPGHVQLCT